MKSHCVHVIGYDGEPQRVKVGRSRNLADELRMMYAYNWRPALVYFVVWLDREKNAEQITNASHDLLIDQSRRLRGEWFDITPVLAEKAVRLASSKIRVNWLSDIKYQTMIDTAAENLEEYHLERIARLNAKHYDRRLNDAVREAERGHY